MTDHLDLAAILGADGKLAMANVDSVPAGRYGKAALVSLHAWDVLSTRVVQADNVRAALAFVARGEAPAGIVYATDAAAEPNVRVAGVFPAASHPPIVYPIALTTTSTNPEARAFLDYLVSGEANAAFTARGFTLLASGS
jgi:molybdate transport system substrate-binding protein